MESGMRPSFANMKCAELSPLRTRHDMMNRTRRMDAEGARDFCAGGHMRLSAAKNNYAASRCWVDVPYIACERLQIALTAP